MGKYGEPWKVSGASVLTAADVPVATSWMEVPVNKFNRLVTCVNALADIDSPAEFVAQAKRDRELLEEARKQIRRVFEIHQCPDCGGDGTLGRSKNGKLISCEMCYGDEDAPGDGFLAYPEDEDVWHEHLQVLSNLLAQLDKEAK